MLVATLLCHSLQLAPTGKALGYTQCILRGMLASHSDNRQNALQKATYAADVLSVQQLLSAQIDLHAQTSTLSLPFFCYM